MKNNYKKYNNFINSISDDTIQNAFYKCSFENYSKWGDCAILEIVKNIPFAKILADNKFKNLFFSSPELSLLKLRDEDFLNHMDGDWERLLNTYDTNKKIILAKENEFLNKLLENDSKEEDDFELENKICLEVDIEIKNKKRIEKELKKKIIQEKKKTEDEFIIVLDKIKHFFDKYNEGEDDLTEEQIDKIFISLSDEERVKYSEIQGEFQNLVNKLNELDEFKIEDEEKIEEEKIEEEKNTEAYIETKKDITKEYEDVEKLKTLQNKFLCLLETMNSLYPTRFKFN